MKCSFHLFFLIVHVLLPAINVTHRSDGRLLLVTAYATATKAMTKQYVVMTSLVIQITHRDYR